MNLPAHGTTSPDPSSHQMQPNNTHNLKISLRLGALAQAIRPDSLKLGSLAWASL